MKLKIGSISTVLMVIATQAANAALVFQVDLQMSGSAPGQTTQADWTAWQLPNTSTASPVNNTFSGIGVTLTAGGGGVFQGRGGSGLNRSTDITGTSWNDVVEDLLTARDGDGNLQIALSGLSAGNAYTLTGWHNDSYLVNANAGFATNVGYSILPSVSTGTLVGVASNGASSNRRNGTWSDSDFDVSSVSFMPAGADASIMLTGSSTSNFLALSGLRLESTPVPGPSTLWLVSLLPLVLLKRRIFT